jgi:hypothetical protein
MNNQISLAFMAQISQQPDILSSQTINKFVPVDITISRDATAVDILNAVSKFLRDTWPSSLLIGLTLLKNFDPGALIAE